ncbi:kinesin-like protein KIN-14J [Andrographis paniculata]|uniref:kinesin-like protein KIN-14J n=1 Tax=Andrographis paniculata TaxID=175694 RepID=UPI0021E8FDDB|nr:kinesin-like protein KIN-14J [Andrographis paniculata]XP_051151325.1 kinesin-like protein KIN-14J [Andrographis paniculata]XP_051151326.1 kinesin-like protein KIN-14J [Andrographis paniculata]
MDAWSEVHMGENRVMDGRGVVHNGTQSKRGNHEEISAIISQLMKLGNLEKINSKSLFIAVNKILDESIEKKNEDIPQHVASVLKLLVQEIEQRNSKQADNMKKQNNLYKSREDIYLLQIKALETLAAGIAEENEVVLNQLQQIKIEKTKIEEKKKLEEQNLSRLEKEKESCERNIVLLSEEFTSAKKSYEENILKLKSKADETKDKLEKKILELECLLNNSRKKIKEMEDFSESKYLGWKRKEQGYRHSVDSQLGSIQELKLASEFVKQEVFKMKNTYAEEFYHFGLNLKGLIDAAQNYHSVLEENRKLYNEVQDLKGNIRVYCRIRPFLPGQNAKQTTIQYIGDNGELVVINPSKPGKDSHRLFKFNKVFSPAATQEEVFQDTQPLIRSVLDGYNVCILAYGQTGSGKTYTMSGPSAASTVDWGVNYRALNDLFNISQKRHSSIAYDIGVQMVEIYNEQVRDLLRYGSSHKKLGIWNTSQPHGLAVPDASLHPVNSTADVLELMNIGLTNRATGATALNERSSRSHSILTVHVRGMDLETQSILRGCLHLVDLAGSERVDRSEATGDRLREAQHINKSLSALGDVIFALAQKSPHVPYRNSKLTQVLQSSLGGQAKTLMFVQLNPDVESYSETTSTLKFAERVSGVELGAARSNKEGRGVRELMEQVASLKDVVAKKDEEIASLRLAKTNGSSERHGINSPMYGSASSRIHSVGTTRKIQRLPRGKSPSEKAVSDNSSEYSDKHSETGSQQSVDDFKHHKEFFLQSRLAITGGGKKFSEDPGLIVGSSHGDKSHSEDIELLGFGDPDSEERLSDISDGVLSMATETDGSINSIVEYTLFPETAKPTAESTDKSDAVSKPTADSKFPRPPRKQSHSPSGPSLSSPSKSSSKIPISKKATASSSTARTPRKRQ